MSQSVKEPEFEPQTSLSVVLSTCSEALRKQEQADLGLAGQQGPSAGNILPGVLHLQSNAQGRPLLLHTKYMLTLTHVCTRMKEELYANKNNAIHADTNETILKGTPWSKSQRPRVCLQLNYSALSSFHIYYISQIVHWGTLIQFRGSHA